MSEDVRGVSNVGRGRRAGLRSGADRRLRPAVYYTMDHGTEL